ncbi:hypothetical protein NLU13_0859 [Sarocladium strictum]|uniref:Sensitive to high expression protein 9, mitochondrial n=1 Tax=Sarocladium strictum TaxID=5046 RepID=A0AA39GPV1_SARSR|nr:hypothetical protein NLU13_0859 [Sarocladium strictum]
MRAFVRPAARLAWNSPRTSVLGLPVPAQRSWQASQRNQTCLQCRMSSLSTFQFRLYSSDIKAKDSKDVSASPKETASTSLPQDAESELPSSHENRRSDIQQRFSHIMDTLQTRALNASQTLNDVTGYSSIEAIKAENDKLEANLAQAHERLRAARAAYKSSNAKRAATQREVTTLLARKDGWTPTDLERFTELYRTDHVLEGEVVAAQEALTEAEAEEQSLGQKLNAGILKRYHEEQIWSDRIRRASTWGTWGLMGMNVLLFLVLQFVAEPWKRKRLVRGVVEEEKQVLEEVRAELESVKVVLLKREELAIPTHIPVEAGQRSSPVDEEVPVTTVTWRELLSDPSRWRTLALDLGSERKVELTMRDASILALEGVVAGAAVAGTVTLLLVRG